MSDLIKEIPDLDGEVWVNISGYNEKYQISNLGRVKSFKYKQPYLLCLEANSKGYLRVSLHKHGRRQRVFVHRLVAQYFVPNDDPLTKNTVDHIDGNKLRNTYDNLQWLSLSDNIRAYNIRKKKSDLSKIHSQEELQ